MQGLVCMVQASWLEDLEGVPDTEQDMVLGNLVRAFFTGESMAGRFDGLLMNLYRHMEREVLRMRAAALAGRKGGMKRAAKHATEHPSKGAAEDTANQITNNEELITNAIAISGGDALKCLLRAWNEKTGKDMRSWPKRARDGIEEALDNGRTVGELERCIDIAMTWEPRYRTPTGVFADGRVEQWLNRPKEPGERGWPHEAPCPSCGGSATLQTPGIYRCPSCGAVFKGMV